MLIYRKKAWLTIALAYMISFAYASHQAPDDSHTNSDLADRPYQNQDAKSQAAWRTILKKYAIRISITCLGIISLIVYIIRKIMKNRSTSPPADMDDIDNMTHNIQADPQALVGLVSEENREEAQDLLNALDDHDPDTRREAIQDLSNLLKDASFTGLDIIAPFTSLLENEQDHKVQKIILDGLMGFTRRLSYANANLLNDAHASLLHDVLDQLATTFKNSQEEDISRLVLRVTSRLPFTNVNHEKASEIILETAMDTDIRLGIRSQAVAALGVLSCEKAIDVIIDCLKDPYSLIRLRAVDALLSFKAQDMPDHHVTTLIGRLQEGESDDDIRRDIVDFLSSIQKNEAMEAIRYAARHDPSELVRNKAQEVLQESNH